MVSNEAGVLRNIDPEHLHNFRIAVRRSRTALVQLRAVFPLRTVRRFAIRLAWLGKITGEARDLDVYLLGFDALKADLPEPFQANIEPLRECLAHRAEAAHAELARQLLGQRYQKLLVDWRAFLLSPCPASPASANALKPAQDLADARIWKLFNRVLKQGRAICPDTAPAAIHELRKSCKKLRYMLEIFRALYPAEAIARPIKQLKKLQDYLGDFQDVHTRIDTLNRVSQTMRENPKVPTEAILALGILLAVLDGRQKELRKSFPAHFEPFARNRNRLRFRALVKSGNR
jgi:CHAD domain-containing protein